MSEITMNSEVQEAVSVSEQEAPPEWFNTVLVQERERAKKGIHPEELKLLATEVGVDQHSLTDDQIEFRINEIAIKNLTSALSGVDKTQRDEIRAYYRNNKPAEINANTPESTVTLLAYSAALLTSQEDQLDAYGGTKRDESFITASVVDGTSQNIDVNDNFQIDSPSKVEPTRAQILKAHKLSRNRMRPPVRPLIPFATMSAVTEAANVTDQVQDEAQAESQRQSSEVNTTHTNGSNVVGIPEPATHESENNQINGDNILGTEEELIARGEDLLGDKAADSKRAFDAWKPAKAAFKKDNYTEYLAGIEPVKMGAYDNDNTKRNGETGEVTAPVSVVTESLTESKSVSAATVEAQAKQLERKSSRLINKSKVAVAIATSVLPILGAWTMIDKPQENTTDTVPHPQPTEIVTTIPEENAEVNKEDIFAQLERQREEQTHTFAIGETFSGLIFEKIGGGSNAEFEILDTDPKLAAALTYLNIDFMLNDPLVIGEFPGETKESLEKTVQDAFRGVSKAQDKVLRITDLVSINHQRVVPELGQLKLAKAALEKEYSDDGNLYHVQTDEELQTARQQSELQNTETESALQSGSTSEGSDTTSGGQSNSEQPPIEAAGAATSASEKPVEKQGVFGRMKDFLRGEM